MGAQQNLKILGIGADGDLKFRKYYFERLSLRREPLHNVISIPHKRFNFVSVVKDIQGLTVQILNVWRVLVLGNGFLMIEDLMTRYEGKNWPVVYGRVTFL